MRDTAGQLAERLHFLHLRELLARAFELDLGLLALGDVEADAVHADDGAGLVLHQLDTSLHVADLAVRPHDPALAAEALARLDRGLHLHTHLLAVVRMDALEIAIERAGQLLARLHAENLVELLRPDDLAGFEVAHPAAEIGEALRLHQMPGLLVEHALDPLAAIDLVVQGEVRTGEVGGARGDPPVEVVVDRAQLVLGAPAHRPHRRSARGSAPSRRS